MPFVSYTVKTDPNTQTLKRTLLALAPCYRKVAGFGFFTSLMVLAPSWYMLEVYDRVIYSRNLTTLGMLTGMVIFIYLIMEALEWVRRKLMYAAALQIEETLRRKVFDDAFHARLQAADFPIQQVFSDFRIFKESLASPAILGLLDLPYVLIFIVAIFCIHPALGYLTLGGLALQIVVAFFNQYRVNPQLNEANRHAIAAQSYFANITGKAEVVQAMGMLDRLQQRWLQKQQAFLDHQAQASVIAGKSSALSKLLQVMQTSLVLGLSCYLVINNDIEHGAVLMIVASILAARVLSPFVQLIAQWRTLAVAMSAFDRLETLFAGFPHREKGMPLPPPTGEISVEHLSYALPGPESSSREVFLKNIHFRLSPGEVLLVAGPSASGKSTLARLLVGLGTPRSGKVRYNGVDVHQWGKAELGQHIGYLPQNIELLDGTLAENIARFGEVDEQKLAAVIDLLDLHAFVDALPDGLHTRIGSEGAFLSGGRRQLVGLARAIYGDPRIVVLDEPNANLDEASDRVMHHMIRTLKGRGTTFVIISHLQGIQALADQMLILMYGQVYRYGKPAEVMASLQPRPASATAETGIQTA